MARGETANGMARSVRLLEGAIGNMPMFRDVAPSERA